MDTIRVPRIGDASDPMAGSFWAGAGTTPGDDFPSQHMIRLCEEYGQIGFWWQEIGAGDIAFSPGLARMIGLPSGMRLTRANFIEAIHPDDLRYQDDLLKLIDVGQPLRREFRIVRPDGIVRWVSCKIDVVVGSDGDPVRFLGIVADVTERREAFRAVEYHRERRAALLEAVSGRSWPDPIWLADADGTRVDFSAFARLTGLAIEECRGDGWARAVHPEDRERVLGGYREAARSGRPFEATYRIGIADGSFRRIVTRAVPVRDRTGAVLEWQGVNLPVDGVRDGEAPEEAEPPALTGAQIRGARGLLDWSLAQLASASGVSVSTIKRMEDGSEGSTRPVKAGAVRRALEEGGVSFRTVDAVTWISV